MELLQRRLIHLTLLVGACRSEVSHDARCDARLRRSLFSFPLAIAASAVARNRIDRPARTLTSYRKDWRNVSSESKLQRRQRHQRIALILRFIQCIAIDEMSLNVS